MSDTRWYQDAVIYELHVRAFFDADGDGRGDFRGLTQRLDYLADLGVTAIWLLPFYPSPGKDDGYDIADYTGVNPDYGTLRDVRRFIREAHRRGLRVITELVCNHTSDQHPWFQRARRAPAGSPFRDFYVWSDDPGRYADARIIFKDFEHSNWAWDHEAQAYYWHRFYAHQPDLNFESPRVREAVMRAMDFWLEMGVDGLRLDAVPYLYEREGTNCENLPETHGFLRQLRAHVDERFEDRMLLAEANQWPEDAVAYFGDGDECHMCFHFPVMPRMFMALRMEDRFPIIDILEQTPSIPDTAQWALFLRNHDELTLEMVTDEERDYMYRVYAEDPQARINLGIRRRLAPLMGNNRRRIELMNGLLFSLPGTPVLYYGDEIGMGDNVYLGDRNGVRTPMQWNGDRNAGFSDANRQRLYLPVITDPEYHYEAINVEVQQANPQSLLWWMKRLIALRKQYRAFGRGSLTFLHPENRKVLVFVRELGEERILVVANLSRYVQYVELDLSAYAGQVPVEMMGQVEFPRIGELPYFLTMGPHSFYWFQLTPALAPAAATDGGLVVIPPAPDLATVLARGPANDALLQLLPAYLRGRRWFGAKARRMRTVRIVDRVALPIEEAEAELAVIEVTYGEGDPDRWALPLVLADDDVARRTTSDMPHALLAQVGEQGALLYDGSLDPRVQALLLDVAGGRRRVAGESGGSVTGRATGAFRRLRGDGPLASVVGRAEQSNTSVVFGDRLIMKLYRRLQPGENPEIELGRALTAARFPHAPAVAGWLAYRSRDGKEFSLGVIAQLVTNEGDLWAYTQDELGAFAERAAASRRQPPETPPVNGATLLGLVGREPPVEVTDAIGRYLGTARLLGERTAALHRALATVDDPAFAPEPYSLLYQRSLYQGMRAQSAEAMTLLRRRLDALTGARPAAEALLAVEGRLRDRFQALLGERLEARRTRIHGDYHAGQVLWTGRDVVIIDFEGEPARPLTERRLKRSPLVDVAGMIRSFHYAARGALVESTGGPTVRAEDVAAVEPWLRAWHAWVSAAFLGAWLDGIGDLGLVPADHRQLGPMLDAFLLAKGLYEVAYELNSRPDWVGVPIEGVLELLGEPLPAASDGD